MSLCNYLMTNIISYDWLKMTFIANVNVFIIQRGLLCNREQHCRVYAYGLNGEQMILLRTVELRTP